MRYSKIIVALIIALNAGFALAALYSFIKVGAEPAVLTAAWFAFTTGELWLLAGIRKKEIKGSEEDTNHDH